MPVATNRKKIAVLGGGMASLTTVFELTNHPNWEAMYDITVYQLGWRLGGKGASGRNMKTSESDPESNYRIEEHGLHIFFGFYENAFRLMKQCFDELGDEGPFDSIEDAFKPHSFVALQDYYNGHWTPWPFNFPTNDLVPWEGDSTESLWDYLVTTLELLYSIFLNSSLVRSRLAEKDTPVSSDQPSWWVQFAKQFELGLDALGIASEATFLNIPERLIQLLIQDPLRWWTWWEGAFKQVSAGMADLDFNSEGAFLYLAYKLAQSLPTNPKTHWREHHRVILRLLDRFMERINDKLEGLLDEDEGLRKDLIIMNFGYVNTRGVLAQELLYNESLDALDHLDYREWLKQNGAWDATLNCPLVRALYDLVYAFEDGNILKLNLAAGVALRGYVNIIFRYKGALMWKMQAGMGDVIFAPFYKVLKRRGVKFEFFHRITGLHLTEDQQAIASISLNRQITLKPEVKEYDPLITVKRLLCWPSEPLYDQIIDTQAKALQDDQINLESFWTPWKEKEEVLPPLQAGVDFDIVVLGISLSALPFLCKELIYAEKNPAHRRWQSMVEKVKTVTTQGGQLWLADSLSQLGWKMPRPVVGTYVEPLDTYADMSFLIEKENWSSANYPYNLAYFTGVIEDPGLPPEIDHGFPARAQKAGDDQAIHFLENQIGYLWPQSTPPDNPMGLDWNLLVDPENRQGSDRFQSQYWRINIDPTERYVISVAGSTQYRLKADESGFTNLYLSGDWINNGFNAGCIEATVMAGMQAARAVLQNSFQTDYLNQIIAEWDDWL